MSETDLTRTRGAASDYDVVIRDGIVVDGTRAPRFRGDIAITDGRIVELGRIRGHGRTELDATGAIVAPGFVDLHTHYDAQVFWDPSCSISGWHGVTSVAIGNCGFGFSPVRPSERERAMMSMTRVEAIPLASMQAGMPWDWVTFPEYLDSVERTPKAVNVLPFVPVGPMLIWVLGLADAKSGRSPTPQELDTLCGMLDESLDAGGCGWSVQHLPPTGTAAVQRDCDGTPMVTDVMDLGTCIALAGVLGRRNEGTIQVSMVTGDVQRDRRFHEELASISGRPVLFNVVQAFDRRPEVHRSALRWLARCRDRGIRVYGQGLTTDAGYTFTFEDWNLFDNAEAWCEATTGTLSERLEKLADPDRRPALRAELPELVIVPIPEIVVLGARSDTTRPFENLTIGEVARLRGVHPVDAMLDIAVADGLKTLFFANPPNSSVEYLREIVEDPWVLFGVSDGGAHTKFLTAGRYPTETLVKVVREHQMLDLEEAHWRLSALPATVAGLHGRGTLEAGAAADVVVYDQERLALGPVEVVHDLPGGEWRRVQRASGYRWVLVNGAVTVQEDVAVPESRPGRLLRRGRG